MIPSSFDYARPTSVDEAVSALASGGEDAKILAGGQSFIPVLRLRLAAPSTVVDLGRIEELRQVTEDGDNITIGSMVTHADVLTNALIGQHLPLLTAATDTVADRQVRNRGTLGGALAHADPAGDLGAVAVALDATFEVAGSGGRRTVAAADFFQDYLTTVLGEGDVLVGISFPKQVGYGVRYEKFNRMAQAWATVGVAAAVKVEGGNITDARVALTNMSTVPVRATAVEQALVGKPANAQTIEAAAQQAAEGTNPTDDLSAKADYRVHLAKVLTKRAVTAAAGI
ncbi:carbon monoxide dehydrogenase medium subunit [Antricoccus suffuscus]|uniref:Carbon monoxide dehydrogenase medium subunit n=1 Tax=Antricoccus suffuscus TaxID=1629062 RepID=A0A2T0ZZF5_9ACTN|nr:xanthine dehydrogenase family protein subunit M [Antricoccus suffuscus]PRZ41664.1 carbon monoxide dehydrogenase medium subunit [Antricoccus suffuscus]